MIEFLVSPLGAFLLVVIVAVVGWEASAVWRLQRQAGRQRARRDAASHPPR